MQPSPSVAAPVSSSSWSPGPLATMVWPGGHSADPPPPPPPPPGVVVVVDLVVVVVVVFETTTGTGGATVTPIPMSPFIPAAACPTTVHRYSYFPFFLSTSVSVAFCPCFRIPVTLPTQLFFAALDVGVVQILKSW